MKVAFSSDNIAGASEAVMQAMMTASQGDVMPYGNDEYTVRATAMLSELFECEVEVFLVSTGTAAKRPPLRRPFALVRNCSTSFS